MNDKIKWASGGAWLAASFLALLLPVFLPSFPDPQGIGLDPIGAATTLMSVLAFPAGLLSIPIEYITHLFGVDPNTMGGMYLNLKILFGLGLVQWFWIMPRLLRRIESTRSEIKRLNGTFASLNAGDVTMDADFFNSRTATPVERVIDDQKDR